MADRGGRGESPTAPGPPPRDPSGVPGDLQDGRSLAEGLHDTAIQNLLSARHDLEEAADTLDPTALARADRALADAVVDLREALFELHPYVLEAAGLEAALSAVGRFVLTSALGRGTSAEVRVPRR